VLHYTIPLLSVYSFFWLLGVGAVGSSCADLGGEERFTHHEIYRDTAGLIRMSPTYNCKILRN